MFKILAFLLLGLTAILGAYATPCGTSLVLGYNTQGAAQCGGCGGIVMANKWTAPSTGIVYDLNYYVPASGGNIRLAIYDDLGGSPNRLLAETASTASTINAWNTLLVTNSGAYVTKGVDYWLAMQISVTTSLVSDAPYTGNSKFSTQAYGAFPDPIVAPSTFDAKISMYTNVCGGAGALQGGVSMSGQGR